MNIQIQSVQQLHTSFMRRALIYSRLEELRKTNSFYKDIKFVPKPWEITDNVHPTAKFLEKYPTDFDIEFTESSCTDNASFCTENVVGLHCLEPQTCTSNFISEQKSLNFCQKSAPKVLHLKSIYIGIKNKGRVK